MKECNRNVTTRKSAFAASPRRFQQHKGPSFRANNLAGDSRTLLVTLARRDTSPRDGGRETEATGDRTATLAVPRPLAPRHPLAPRRLRPAPACKIR